MATLRSVQIFICAGALVIGAGCSKEHEAEEAALEQPTVTEGSEAEDISSRVEPRDTSGMDSELETQRMDESSRESSAAKATEEKPAQGGTLQGDQMQAMPGETGAAPVTDSQIAFITDVVNTGEIEQAQVAKTKAGTPQVKRFAQHMITEHRKARQAGTKVVKQADITPEKSPTATKIEDEGTGVLESLRSTDPGEGFDRLYMESQVMQHQKVLDMLDSQLIPSAQNPKLKAELQKSREMVERHLTQAREIQQSMID